MPGGRHDRWFLSFDCATKSFAFALLRLRRPAPDLPARAAAVCALALGGGHAEAARAAARLEAETAACLRLAAGGAADLAPGRKDSDISTVERVRAVHAYLESVVARALAGAAADGCPPPDAPELNVAVEFQMGANARSRAVAHVLLARYSRANVFLVGPAYKNKLWYPSRPRLRHCYFVERYKSLYTANKKHSQALYFSHIAQIFDHDAEGVLARVPLRLRADIADCVVQVLGFMAFDGDLENAAAKF